MLVSHLNEFIFTKTSKTASTSVEVYFERFCISEQHVREPHSGEMYVSDAGIIGQRGTGATGHLWYNHMPARKIKDQLGPQIWDSYFKFTTVRNPFDKIISGFHFELPNAKKLSPYKPVLKAFFREWLLTGKLFNDRDRYVINNELCIDYFIKYDDLHAGVQHVCEKLNLPFDRERLPKLKSTYRPEGLNYSDYYEADTLAKVANYYLYEIKKFGFSIPRLA